MGIGKKFLNQKKLYLGKCPLETFIEVERSTYFYEGKIYPKISILMGRFVTTYTVLTKYFYNKSFVS